MALDLDAMATLEILAESLGRMAPAPVYEVASDIAVAAVAAVAVAAFDIADCD